MVAIQRHPFIRISGIDHIVESIKVSVRAKADESTHRTGESEAMLKSDEQVPQMLNSVRMRRKMEEFEGGEALRSRL